MAAKSIKKVQQKPSLSIVDPKNFGLAIIGALAFGAETSKNTFERLVKRGEVTQKDFGKKVEEFRSVARKRIEEIQERVQKTLNRVGISQEKAETKEKVA